MGIASSLKKASSKALIKLGGDVTIKRSTNTAYDMDSGEINKIETSTTVKGFLENVVQREVNDLVTEQDKKLTISAQGLDFVPKPKDYVIIASIEYKIIQIDTNELNNIAISYELYLRG